MAGTFDHRSADLLELHPLQQLAPLPTGISNPVSIFNSITGVILNPLFYTLDQAASSVNPPIRPGSVFLVHSQSEMSYFGLKLRDTLYHSKV